MAYRMAQVLVTLNDLEGHSSVAGLCKCNPWNICAAFYQISADCVVARFLGDSWASCCVYAVRLYSSSLTLVSLQTDHAGLRQRQCLTFHQRFVSLPPAIVSSVLRRLAHVRNGLPPDVITLPSLPVFKWR